MTPPPTSGSPRPRASGTGKSARPQRAASPGGAGRGGSKGTSGAKSGGRPSGSGRSDSRDYRAGGTGRDGSTYRSAGASGGGKPTQGGRSADRPAGATNRSRSSSPNERSSATGYQGNRGSASSGASRAGGAGGRPTSRTGSAPTPSGRPPSRTPVTRKGWGSVARRGASTVREGVEHGPDKDTPEGRRRARRRTDEFVPEQWIEEDRNPKGATSTRRSSPRPVPPPAELPPDIANELASAAGPDWSHLRARITERMAAGIGAYQRERFRDASRILKTVVDAVPNAPSARELLALSQYHQGYWKAALINLEAFATLTGSVDQHPVRMDCQRALGRPKRVEALFTELRQGSPDPEVLSEGRLVLAGTRADDGDLTGAIAVLTDAGAGRLVRNPAERHLRQWYVLGDLMERSGDLPKARELFLRVAATDPEAYDVVQRLESLGPPARPRRVRTPRKPD